jgi:hypothetical protein
MPVCRAARVLVSDGGIIWVGNRLLPRRGQEIPVLQPPGCHKCSASCHVRHVITHSLISPSPRFRVRNPRACVRGGALQLLRFARIETALVSCSSLRTFKDRGARCCRRNYVKRVNFGAADAVRERACERELASSKGRSLGWRADGRTSRRRPAPRAGGAEGNRTPDLCSAIAALSHLSYSPAPPACAVKPDANRAGRAAH